MRNIKFSDIPLEGYLRGYNTKEGERYMRGYPRGAEWRRWDLHLHTPETKKNDQYSGKTAEEKWDSFYSKIEKYISDGVDSTKNIAVIGITDYLSIDNYLKVIKDERLPKSVKLVVPNIEMRIQPVSAKTPINIHFIFDPHIVDSLESCFFGKLEFSYGTKKFSARKDELVRLGKEIKLGAPDEQAYIEGLAQFVPTLESVKEVFRDSELRDSTIIGVSNSTSDGVSGITSLSSYCEEEGQPSQLTLTRQDIYRFVDFIFSAKQSDIQYFLGEKKDSEKTVIEKCGSLKPCLHGSDAHELNKIFEPDEKRYCWVKADPTFNGLRQVLYEPKERVRISPLKPETKVDYHVIDKVEIESDEFSKESIFLNDKLTSIVGGKSTGKSVLLNNIALAIDPKQVNEKMEISRNHTKILSKVKVYWADGTASVTGEEDNTHKIIFIPHTYLNRLSDENGESTEIDGIIQDIVLLNPEANLAYRLMGEQLQKIKPERDKQIYDMVRVYNEMNELHIEENEIGSKEGIEKEIGKLKKQKEKLSKELALSENDIKEYDDAIESIISIEKRIEIITNEAIEIKRIESVVKRNEYTYTFEPDTKTYIEVAIDKAIKAADDSWVQSCEKIIEKSEKVSNTLKSELTAKQAIRDGLKDKMESNEALGNLSKIIQAEEKKLLDFEKIGKKIEDKEITFKGLLQDLADTFLDYSKIRRQYAESINGNTELQCSDLEFFVTVPFRDEAFISNIKQLFDNRNLKTKRDIIDIDNFKIEDFTSVQIQKLIVLCLNGELPIKGQNKESVIRSLLDDWHNITYSVKMDGDMINQMSPGKKALVLLKLLIDLADSKSPILIDQPEDDLDNRSVFDDLIPFIKEKKIQRQIIVVTHNANVVLGGDAEEIIIANQHGTNAENKQYQFEYRTGAIEDDCFKCDDDGNQEQGILNEQGIQQHICDILEGGERAFDLRKHKYRINT